MCQNKYTSLYVLKPIKFQYDKVPLGVNVRDPVLLEIQCCFPKALFGMKTSPLHSDCLCNRKAKRHLRKLVSEAPRSAASLWEVAENRHRY